MTPETLAIYFSRLNDNVDNAVGNVGRHDIPQPSALMNMRDYLEQLGYLSCNISIIVDYASNINKNKNSTELCPITLPKRKICPTIPGHGFNSILLKRLAFEAKFFSTDYNYPFVVKTLKELTDIEDDDKMIFKFSKDRSKSIDSTLKEYCKQYVKSRNPQVKAQILSRITIPNIIGDVFFNGQRCDVCTQTSARKCLGCKVACYCSKDCQEKDYNHKKNCAILSKLMHYQLEKTMSKFGVEISKLLVNNIWTISVDTTSTSVQELVLSKYSQDVLSHVEEGRNQKANETTSRSICQEVEKLLILYEWLETHFSPCSLNIDCTIDGKTTYSWIIEKPNSLCTICKADTIVFCRSCTMMNCCQSCNPKIHHKDHCSKILGALNEIVKRITYRSNTF